jgi:hypothetical protein
MADQQLKDAVEDLMDRNTAFMVLMTMAAVCGEKADYVREGGSHGEPSEYMAGQWQKLAKAVEKAADKVAGL